jgi:hypothetical protein
MVSTLISECELLLSREHGFAIFSLHQGRKVICSTFLWTEGVQDAESHICSYALYGGSAVSHRNVHRWIELFKKGWASVIDAEGMGGGRLLNVNKQ